MRILVIIPALNEEKTVRSIIHGIRTFLPRAEILVVNDGSTDSTGSVAREEGVFVLDHPFNMGIGATMQTGFLFARDNGYDIAVQVDGDGQHNPESLPALVKPIEEGTADLVIGSRYLSRTGFKSTFFRQVGIRFFSGLLWVFTRRRVTDPTSGFRAMDQKVLRLFSEEYPSDYPEVEALVSAHKNGLRFEEIPTIMRDRQGGISSIGILSAMYYMTKVTLAITVGFFRRVI